MSDTAELIWIALLSAVVGTCITLSVLGLLGII